MLVVPEVRISQPSQMASLIPKVLSVSPPMGKGLSVAKIWRLAAASRGLEHSTTILEA
jgi:hypothetical protein